MPEEIKASINEKVPKLFRKKQQQLCEKYGSRKEIPKNVSRKIRLQSRYVCHWSSYQCNTRNIKSTIECYNISRQCKKIYYENISEFIDDEGEEEETLSALLPMLSKKAKNVTQKYKVNLLVDNSAKAKGRLLLLTLTLHTIIWLVKWNMTVNSVI